MATSYPSSRPTIDYPFSAVPWDLVSDERLGAPEVRVYAALVRMCFEDTTGRGQYGHAEIAGLAQCSERSVCRPLLKLEETGWIERHKVLTGHGRQPDRFHIHTERDSKRAEVRSGVDSNHADSRRRDHANLRGPTSLKEEEKTVPLFGEDQVTADPVPAAPTKAEIEADFDEWYKTYPRKKKPGDARKAYAKARKIATKRQLLDGAEMLARLVRNQQQELKFTPYPATWLNAESWTEDVEPERSQFEPPPMRFG